MTKKVAKKNKVLSLHEKLRDPKNPRAKLWSDAFDAYNKSIGYALGTLQEQPQDIQGREKEIALLHAVLERPKTPIALLLGLAGSGKTALVEEFAKQLNSGRFATKSKHKYLLFALRLGSLSALGTHKIQSTLATMLDKLKEFETLAQKALDDDTIRIVLFIDEVHMLITIFGPGTKIGGDVMKDVLARSPIRVVAATTRREYDSTIAVDKPLAERFKQIELREIAPNIVKKVAYDWWAKVASDCPPLSANVLDELIKANAAYRSDSAEPRKSIDILEDLVSYCRRTGKPATKKQLEDIFNDRYAISLTFHVDADDVFQELSDRIKGQPMALYQWQRLLRSMVYQLNTNTDQPIATALMTGATGTGKALANDTIIPTKDTYKKIRELKVGDVVFDELGNEVEVLGVYPQGKLDAYKVTFTDDTDIICNDEHIWGVSFDIENPTLENKTLKEIMQIKDMVYVPKYFPTKRKSGYSFVAIKRIEKLDIQLPMTCIEVNSASHLYLATKNNIATHNTESTKALADKLYPGEDVLHFINMPDFKTAEHEPAFRKRLGEHVRHTPNSIILLDEFEKAHESVRDSMLQILDEGLVNFEVLNREGAIEVNQASLRNTIVIATTNAGSEVFANDAKFSQRGARGKDELDDIAKSEVDDLMKALIPNLQANGFRPEMLGRFDRIIPYRSLSADTLLIIAEREIQKLVDDFRQKRGIEVITNPPKQWPKNVYPYYTTDLALYIAFIKANAQDANAGGARNIKREIQSNVRDSIIDALFDNPGHTKFKVEVDKNSAIYKSGSASTEGGVIVNAL